MEGAAYDLAASLVSKSYIRQAESAVTKRRNLIKSLLSQRRLPETGWDEASIEQLIQDASLMDSNNFPGNVGVGEREARVACPLVDRRHYRMAHGVGRSGDIAAVQPKAAGSSLLAKLANLLAADALRMAGLKEVSAVTVLPLATGMAITSTLLAIKRSRPAAAKYVLWPRIDQKTCAKCVTAAGLELIVIPNLLEGDQVRTDMVRLRGEIQRLGPDNIVAVLSTTSCFAPRVSDRLVEIAKLCRDRGVAHIVNNAYGVQSKQICELITAAWRKGRVDAVIQSTDKNFMVPVGGAVVAAGPGKCQVVDAVNIAYPGRASAAPMLDLLITLLHWGASGWRKVLQDREDLWSVAKAKLEAFAASHGCRLLLTPDNPISLAVTLCGLQPPFTPTDTASVGTMSHQSSLLASNALAARDESRIELTGHITGNALCKESGAIRSVVREEGDAEGQLPATFLGSMLFSRFVSGTRVVARGKSQEVAGCSFRGFGAHFDAYPHDYLTMAVALGTTERDVDEFIARLAECFQAFRKKSNGRGQR